jgi:Sec-independent protein secretion pathway component TatC
MTDTKSFLFHLQELRKTLIKCFIAVFLFYIPSFMVTPKFINFIIHWCLPKELSNLNYFAPM